MSTKKYIKYRENSKHQYITYGFSSIAPKRSIKMERPADLANLSALRTSLTLKKMVNKSISISVKYVNLIMLTVSNCVANRDWLDDCSIPGAQLRVI